MKRILLKNEMKKSALIIKNTLTPNQYLILYFFIYSFLGWVLETIFGIIVLGHFTKRGFLFGPLCPIYGFGAIIMLSYISKYKNNSLKVFLFSILYFSIFEYVASFALDAIFSKKWWDYTQDFFNLNGRISLFYSLAWGIVGILFINHIHPFMERKIEKALSFISEKGIKIILYTLPGLIVVDTILSVIKYEIK